MRIIAGAWRGRQLAAPPGTTTRPTADRVRQAAFDMLSHASWAGEAAIRQAAVLDVFAGTGGFGLEALSRGAAHAHFLEMDKLALAALRANITACRADQRCTVLAADATKPPPGRPCNLVFLDPPYGRDLVSRALSPLGPAGWLAPNALLVAEIGRADPLPMSVEPLADRSHGSARLVIWRG